VAPTPSDPETRCLVNTADGDLESTSLLSPSLRGRRDSDLSAASEPPDFTPEQIEDLRSGRGSISKAMIKSMFTGERPSRSPSRSQSPSEQQRPSVQHASSRSHSYQFVGDREGQNQGNG
jgi:hypothetical protein